MSAVSDTFIFPHVFMACCLFQHIFMLTQQTAATFRLLVLSNLVSRAEGLKFVAQAVSRRPFRAETVFQSQASPCQICGVRSD
jgi:hypothetical protein